MAKWTNYYKLVQPSVGTAEVTDNQEIGTPNTMGSYNWYHRVISGSGARLSRYKEFDNMDADIDISRALDLIAEEITGNCTKSDDPLELNVIDLDHMTSSEVNTVKTALRHWSEIHRWKSKMFKIARYTVKFGDIFFKKKDPISKWIFVHPKDVSAAIVNSEDITDVQAWQVKEDLYDVKTAGGSPMSGMSGMYNNEVITVDKIVRFTLNDDMSIDAPFGESVLKPVYKTFKQKELLEDAVIIYRIQRAPERRVFYIDVGKMPPNRVKQYLEQIKNEIRQKKIPTHNGANSEVDSVYNPQSQSEDYFLAQKCISLDTKIRLIDGKLKTLYELIGDYESGIINYTYSINQKTGIIGIAEIEWAGITRKNTNVVKITLENSESLICTEDHKLILYNGEEVEASDLAPGDELSSNSSVNHIVSHVNKLDNSIDTGCLTIKDASDNHNFELESGIFIKNSDGRGSKIETLPGGQSVGEISDVEYFADKMFRGLHIPLSYMKEGDAGGAIFNDGKMGQAYITELRFSLYIERLQSLLEEVLDKEFKAYLRYIGLKIDNSKFNIVLPEPSNFGKYREQEMFASLLSSYSSADGIEYLSKKFIMSKYLQMSNDEVIENERMKLEEMGVDPDAPKPEDLIKIYSPDSMESDLGGDLELGGEEMAPDIEEDIPV